MNNSMEYKGYVGTVEYSDKDNILFGKVLGIKGLVSYEGESVGELRRDFEEAVDDYLEICAAKNIEPEKTYKGSFNVRIAPELHKKASLTALSKNISLNNFVEEAVRAYVAQSTI